MTKRFIFSVAAIAIMFVSCSQNEMEVVNVTTSDAISLNPSTAVTRATITYKNTLETGFSVYATTTGNAWYSDDNYPIDGTHKHALVGGKWNFVVPTGEGIKWPDAGNYPIEFFAYYPIAHKGITVLPTTPTPTDLRLEVVIQDEVLDQIDIVSAKNSTTIKPATANLSLNFEHILSKVNFAVSNSYDVAGDVAYVQAVGFNNVNSKNDFDVIDQKWNSNHSVLKPFNYYNAFVGLDPDGTDTYTEISFPHSVDKAPFYDASSTPKLAEANMMLLPQTPTNMWIVTTTPSTPATGEAYVRVMYRYEHNQDKNFIGFEFAQNHPAIKESTSHKNYNGPLYVLAGFTYDGSWLKGKGYMYNIPLPGDGGGRLLDEYLYDDKGNRTDLKYPGGEEGEPVITTDAYIHLIPIVTDWGTDIDEDLEF